LTTPDAKSFGANDELAIQVESANGAQGVIVEILL
jgi:hypothetical protein